MKIAIYAGHGGSDPGTTNDKGQNEKTYALEISNAVTEILQSWGYTIINNRTTDVERSITLDARRANEHNVAAVVEIHLNSNEGPPCTGSEAFVSIRDATQWNGRAKELADAILTRLSSLGFVNHGVFTSVNRDGIDTLGILRLTQMPTVLVEVACLNNPEDMARMDISRVANAIADGIRAVFRIA